VILVTLGGFGLPGRFSLRSSVSLRPGFPSTVPAASSGVALQNYYYLAKRAPRTACYLSSVKGRSEVKTR
jgi:hypothetical protein